jgi:putative transcriptional regulator
VRDPHAGVLIQGTGGLRKLRVAAQGNGKRGGARLIYFVVDPAQQCRMLLIYRKGVQDDLSEDQKGSASAHDRELDMMNPKLFDELLESVTQMGEIARGERAPAREFVVEDVDVRLIRKATGLSQARFAKVVAVPLGTLRNWEQGRRAPTGPAKVLLKVIEKDPKAVLEAVASR